MRPFCFLPDCHTFPVYVCSGEPYPVINMAWLILVNDFEFVLIMRTTRNLQFVKKLNTAFKAIDLRSENKWLIFFYRFRLDRESKIGYHVSRVPVFFAVGFFYKGSVTCIRPLWRCRRINLIHSSRKPKLATFQSSGQTLRILSAPVSFEWQ